MTGGPDSNTDDKTSSTRSPTGPTVGPKPQADLADLQPALAAARAAWRPYQQPINQLEHELRTTLRPAMWKANNQARRAGFGHRHSAARRAAEASRRVADTQARIDAIQAEGQAVKEHLDALEADARDPPRRRSPTRSPQPLRGLRPTATRHHRPATRRRRHLPRIGPRPTRRRQRTRTRHRRPHRRRPTSPVPTRSTPTRSAGPSGLSYSSQSPQLLRDRGIELDVDEHLERRGPELGLGL